MELKKLNRETAGYIQRPVRILQFGEGNFLRAFVDWQIDIADHAGVIDTNVAIVSPRFDNNAAIQRLKAQEGMYHVTLEGIENGQPKREVRLVTCVADVLAPELPADYEKYMGYILSPELRFVVSNTTEAGIRYEEDDVRSDFPKTFPGKVVNLLWKRWKHFDGAKDKGLIFMCCELIENNGTTLREYVLRHAREAAMEEEFIAWIENDCIFVDTLVDRIVPGFPRDTIEQLKEEVGFDDNCFVKGELYHLWAIGGKGFEVIHEELPLDKAGLHALFMPCIKAFRDKKVRILNGSHTGMVPVALQLGCETVMDAFNDGDVNSFINDMVAEEVLPMIQDDPAELKTFAAGILERFYNPYIKHYLKSIALNSLSKWEARNFPTVKDNAAAGKVPAHEYFTLAALLSLYGPGSGFTPEDDPRHVEAIAKAWNPEDFRATVADILNAGIFIEDFEAQAPGLTDAVAGYLGDIRAKGMRQALADFLAANK